MSIMAKRRHIPIPPPERIKAIREKLDLTQAEAADRVGVGQGVWSDWESGKRRPSRQSAILIDLLAKKKL